MQFDFTNKTVVVTGGGSGIGHAAVQCFLKAGARCVSVDLDFPNPIKGVHQICADVSDKDTVDEIKSGLRFCSGSSRLDILINAAGIMIRGDLEQNGFEHSWDRTHNVNVRAPVQLIRGLLPELKISSGAIVNVCSIQSFLHLPNSASYSASKGALAQLTKAVAVELGPYRIRCNAVAPGAIDTPMTKDALNGDYRTSVLKRTPIGRIGQAEDVAKAIAFLSSADAQHITGAILPVDGGFLAN